MERVQREHTAYPNRTAERHRACRLSGARTPPDGRLLSLAYRLSLHLSRAPFQHAVPRGEVKFADGPREAKGITCRVKRN